MLSRASLVLGLLVAGALFVGCDGSAAHVGIPQPLPGYSASSQEPATTAVGSAAPVRSGVPGRPPAQTSPAAREPLPVQLTIQALGISAAVEAVGQTAEGAMDVPKEWANVGWFEKGFRPGERGSAVIAGHLDSTSGPAVFWKLGSLRAGDTVSVRRTDGSTRVFAVVGGETYVFNQAPLARIFGKAARPMLNLVTCNGTFDAGSQNYDKRLVVYTAAADGLSGS